MGSDGREQQENFKKFKLKCLEAYLYLRKQAKMVYNLTTLMLDSGIKDVHNEGLTKLFDKFSINLNDEEAEKYFLLVLEECKNALFPLITDKIHIWAAYFRKWLMSLWSVIFHIQFQFIKCPFLRVKTESTNWIDSLALNGPYSIWKPCQSLMSMSKST